MLQTARHRVNVALWRFTQGVKARFLRFAHPAATATFLISAALLARAGVLWRRLLRRPPRLLWGPVPLLNNKYHSAAMRKGGWQSTTFVDAQSRVAGRDDFDVYHDDLTARSRLPEFLRQYSPFIWSLRHGDVMIRNFDGGFLRNTPRKWKESSLLRLAGKKTVLNAYGSDIAVVGHLGPMEPLFLEDYPLLVEQAEAIRRQVDHAAASSAVIIRTKQVGYQPRYDVMTPHLLTVDPDDWRGGSSSGGDGHDGDPVTIIHAPNHRALKGTEHLERTVEALRREGLRVELQLIEGALHAELKPMILEADIVGDQFVDDKYAMFAIEGMAAGKPVLSGQGDPAFADVDAERGAPTICTDADRLADDLRRLVTDPSLRRELGEAGRQYVRRYHSYEAVAREWEAIVEFAWLGAELPEHLKPR